MSGKLADIDVSARHVADMSPTFPTKMPRDLVTLTMLSGMLDLLCVIPRDKVEGKGIA